MSKKCLVFFIIAVFLLNGCAVVLQKGRRSDVEKIVSLEDEVDKLQQAKQDLQSQLSEEIKNNQVRLNIAEKGLVITFVAEVLFASGKAKLRIESFPILDKVAKILRENVPRNEIGIEGHTDNEPIKYSRWKSNWELSSQRALSVLYYLQEQGIKPIRLSAIGYGEYRPIASNDIPEGKQFNRRVEIVILPKMVKELTEAEEVEIIEVDVEVDGEVDTQVEVDTEVEEEELK